MFNRKNLQFFFSLLVVAAMLLGATGQVSRVQAKPLGVPGSPTDPTKVPHYFGPWPNWANSPFTLPDVSVTIQGPGTANGVTATATAQIGANGTITGFTITNPGSDYSAGSPPSVTIKVASTGNDPVGGVAANAQTTVTTSGAVTGVNLLTSGSGYISPQVVFTGGTPTTLAQATAYGGVDSITLVGPAFGGDTYQFPTVEIGMPDDPNGTQAQAHAIWDTGTGVISSIAVDDPGSGYATAPVVAIRDGTAFDPITHGGTVATAAATIKILSVNMDVFGAGYTAVPSVAINDLTPSAPPLPALVQATASAAIDFGTIGAINLVAPGFGGAGYITKGGIQKFYDQLPLLCYPGGLAALGLSDCPNYVAFPDAKYIPVAVGDPYPANFNITGTPPASDDYVIGLIQYRTNFSSSLKDPVSGLPVKTLARGYVQIDTGCTTAGGTSSIPGSQCFPLANANVNPLLPDDPVLLGGVQAYSVNAPQWLGPTIVATKDKAVRIVFHNLLPTGSGGDLFLPVDSTIMGSGMGPMAGMTDPLDEGTVMDAVRNPTCTDNPQAVDGMGNYICFKNNRATLHLHGGNTPWISDGTPHQWITPASETTPWPQGVSVQNVPDMNVCGPHDDGCQTFFYTNQQSARLMFYHDHAWGITRLNVYAGEAAGYVITDAADAALFLNTGAHFKDLGEGYPLVIQDRTFVPDDNQMYDTDINGKHTWDPGFDPANIVTYGQDPTWDKSRWGGYGSFWYEHVYMPAQNPNDPSGLSTVGRWFLGAWFWPPATTVTHQPITNPYYDPNCQLGVPSTWQYDTDPFCEPPLIPGTPNLSNGMEQFNDTPMVNGVAYPTVTLPPTAVRLRILNAANDRFWNLQWYVADPTTASTALNSASQVIGGTEVAFKPAELAAAQLDPNVLATPDTTVSLPGPDWIAMGTEGGFLPAPTVIDGQQVTTWITDPTRFDWGNVDQHSLVVAPAERADVVVDFSQFAGQTLILYNDAPAAYPGRISNYDYYTGDPDLRPMGAPTTLPGYGPNTRTIMQVKIAPASPQYPALPANAFDKPGTTLDQLGQLQKDFRHNALLTGVFESSQAPIIVGQAAYNSAYGSNFVAGGNCNTLNHPTARCDGFARIDMQGYMNFGFNTLRAPNSRMLIPVQPKALHDEMNAASFDEFGRMTANIGLETVPATPAGQTINLMPYVQSPTEIIDTSGLPRADVKIMPISNAADGTQIWKITHNGVDTHPIHFHATDVQIINRVTWDNIIIPPEASELGWKDTIRVSPLQDTYIAMRPLIPALPFDLPNSVRELSPMMVDGADLGANLVDPLGNAVQILNHLINFGAEYVFHCHILSHEEMDMMRPVILAYPPKAPDNLQFVVGAPSGGNAPVTVSWNDNSISETAFSVQRRLNGGAWTEVNRVTRLLTDVNTTGPMSYLDSVPVNQGMYEYQVVAENTVGDPTTPNFPTLTTYSNTAAAALPLNTPVITNAQIVAGPAVQLTWNDNNLFETGWLVQRAPTGTGTWTTLQTITGANPTATMTYSDATVVALNTYDYRVVALGLGGAQAPSALVTVSIPFDAPTNLVLNLEAGPQVRLTWLDNASIETGYVIERSINGAAFAQIGTTGPVAGVGGYGEYVDGPLQTARTYAYRVKAVSGVFSSGYSNQVSTYIGTNPAPATPTNLTAALINTLRVRLSWTDNASNENSYKIYRSTNGGVYLYLTTNGSVAGTGGTGLYDDRSVLPGNSYSYKVQAVAPGPVASAYSNATPNVDVPSIPLAPTNVVVNGVVRNLTRGTFTLTWNDVATNELNYYVQVSTSSNFSTGVTTYVLPAGTTSYVLVLNRATTYYFQVAAMNYGGMSVYVPSTPASFIVP